MADISIQGKVTHFLGPETSESASVADYRDRGQTIWKIFKSQANVFNVFKVNI